MWLLGIALGDSLPPTPDPIVRARPWARLGALTPVLLISGAPAAAGAFLVATVGAAALQEGAAAALDAARPRLESSDHWSPSHRISRRRAARLRITSWPRVKGDNWQAAATIINLPPDSLDRIGPEAGETVLLRGRDRPPRLWETLRCGLEISAPLEADFQDGFSMARFLRGRGLQWEARLLGRDLTEPTPDPLEWIVLKLMDPLRGWMLGHFSGAYPRREGTLLGSVLLGEKAVGLRDIRGPFAELGLAHLFAVSGLHIGLVASILLVLIRPLRPTPFWRWLLIGLALGVFIILTGMASSSVRAGGLAALALSGPVLGARIDSLRVLGLLFWISIVWQPDLGIDAGFRLSYMAAAGIVLGLRAAGPLLKAGSGAVKWIGGSLLVSLSAQWATLPELAAAFGWVNPLAPLYNLVAVPVFGAAVTLAFIAMLLSPISWIGEALATDAWLLMRLLEVGAAILRQTTIVNGLIAWGPGRLAVYIAGSLALAMLLFAAGRGGGRRPGAALALLLLLGVGLFGGLGMTVDPRRMRVDQFAIGQGDCALFVFPDRHSVLVDTGDCWRSGGSPFAMSVIPWLRRRSITRLDDVVLTHHHADHDGAWRTVAEAVGVDRWWALSWRESLAERLGPEALVISPVAGDTIHSDGRWCLRCLYPLPDRACPEGENNHSIVLELSRDGHPQGLWMGDLEVQGENQLLEAGVPQVQVLKAGHHGSRTSSSPPFLAACRPQHVLLSCGVENRHDHPSHGPFRLDGRPLDLWRTDLQGSLHLEWDPQGRLSLKALRPLPKRGPDPHPAGLSALPP